MALFVPLLPILAAAADIPITVTGRNWAPFISPMGEPFRARSRDDDPLARWFGGADRNHDGLLTADEVLADADRFFATLDTNRDGAIDPVELDHYELEIAPEIQVTMRTIPAPGAPRPKPSGDRRKAEGLSVDALMGTGGALQGGARYGLLNIPEPVAAADTDFDRAVSRAEFRLAAARRFQLLDGGQSGAIRLEQLQALRQAVAGRRPRPGQDVPDERVGNGLPSAN
jgi:hypothetical protein